ncbi:lachesin-like isoform X2 [Tachypleus tridentatus]|uniref:lachesin-like isoform X2 n=2 Tax=Tachypleus tridentatus TaxID=6853 RepID=UPI003FD267D9
MKLRKHSYRWFIHLLVWTGLALGKQIRADTGRRGEPRFAEPIPNVTIAEGRSLTLACVVENLEPYKVSWIHINRHMLLSLHDAVITRNPRFRITHNGHSTWVLHIDNVQKEDQGQYMCQINTNPMISQSGHVTIVVPPKIDDNTTSSDREVKEGSHVALQCRASGIPTPNITWRREDNQQIMLGKKKVMKVVGDKLNIRHIKRTHMGAYLCIASNQVQPSVSKRILIHVKFPPMIWTNEEVLGTSLGTSVTLECHLESYPPSVTYWMRDGDTLVISDSKRDVMTVEIGLYKVEMRLRIRNVDHEDFGSYSCHAKNSLGEVEASINLHGIPSSQVSSTVKSEVHHRQNKQEGGLPNDPLGIGNTYTNQFPSSENNLMEPEKDSGLTVPSGSSCVKALSGLCWRVTLSLLTYVLYTSMSPRLSCSLNP